ncbi:MAG: hypothetical protein IKY16_09395 [Bacteroidales bacterium]|nr:hypothetical protein [Bacteroidales bacterium]
MKKSLLFAAVALAAMTACQDNVVPETPAGNPETYTVKLACAGELEVNHVPLKSSSDDLYGIQVYYAPVSGGSYQRYAYGLFDDVSDVSLELLADYKYKFEIDMIVNGKNVVYSSNMNELEDEEILLGYGKPFQTLMSSTNSGYLLTPISNDFIITSIDYFPYLGEDIQLLDGKNHSIAKGVDAYYGELSDYVPEEEGATIAIHMKHMIFGLKVVADNFLTQGVVEGILTDYIGSSEQDKFTLAPPSATVYEATYAFTRRDNWYPYQVQNDADDDMDIKFSWIKDENTTLKLDWQNIRMIRMKQTIVNVTFFEDESAGNTKVSMVFDDLEMSENETSYTFGDDQEEYEW